MLGIPKREDVYYISKEAYETVLDHMYSRNLNEEDFPLIKELVKNLSKKEEKVLTSLLVFNPNKRPRCEMLLEFPFFKNFTSKKQQDDIDDPEHEHEDNFNQIRPIINAPSSPEERASLKPLDSLNKNVSSQRKAPHKIPGFTGASPSYTQDTGSTRSKHDSNWWNLDVTPIPKDEELSMNRVLKPSNRVDDYQRPSYSLAEEFSSKKNFMTFDNQKSSQGHNLVYDENQPRSQSGHLIDSAKKIKMGSYYDRPSPQRSYKENMQINTNQYFSAQKVVY